MKGWTVYASKTGVEVRAARREREFEHSGVKYKNKEGRVVLRFFKMEDNKVSIRFILNPVEAHKLARYCKHVAVNKPGKKIQVLIHKYEKQGEGGTEEVTTRVYVEHWKNQKSGKEGFALVLSQKGGENTDINVALDKDTLLYLADLLHHLSMEQSWWSVAKVEEGVEEPVEDEPTPSDIDEGEEIEKVPDDIEF